MPKTTADPPSASALLSRTENKISSIGRVLQHLNARADDADLEDASQSAEHEIEGILRDASERVKKIQAAAQAQRDGAALEARAKELEAKYAKERQAAHAQLDEFKKRAQQQQAAAAKQSEARVSAMAKELEEAKKTFAARVKQPKRES